MDNRKVLVVDDMDWVHIKFAMELHNKEVILLKALTLEEGQKLFSANPDICVVVMDACVPGDWPNSQWLVRKIRETFKGPIIAISSMPTYRKELLRAGCDYESGKDDLSKKLLEVLGL